MPHLECVRFKIWHFFSNRMIPSARGGQSLDEPITYVSLTFSLLTLDFGHNSMDSCDGSLLRFRSGSGRSADETKQSTMRIDKDFTRNSILSFFTLRRNHVWITFPLILLINPHSQPLHPSVGRSGTGSLQPTRATIDLSLRPGHKEQRGITDAGRNGGKDMSPIFNTKTTCQ